MKNRLNDTLTAVEVLINNKMYREALELINSARIQNSLEIDTLRPGRGGGGNNARCVVCGDKNGHGGLQCPDFSSVSKQEWMKS